MDHESIESFLEPVYRLHKDVAKAAKLNGMNNQIKGLARDAEKEDRKPEPHDMLEWVFTQTDTLEKQIKRILNIYVITHPMNWFFDQTIGIGPVLAAGLLAHIDIEKAPTAGHIYSFAGLDPTKSWDKGKKRPWNADLKKLCWKIGDSFVKVSGRDDAFYGKLYRERKEYEIDRNDKGLLADQAKAKIEKFNIGKDTDAYKAYSSGKLPPAHIDMRARRYAVKIFLSHLHQCWWEQETGEPPPAPYPIAHLAHAHFMKPPQVKP